MSAELLLGLFVGAAISGVVPLVNAELLVVGAAAVAPAGAIPLVALVSAAGQMLTKTALYGVARWLPARLPAKAREALQRGGDRLAGRSRAAASVIFGSATMGLPPFYGVSLAAGALRVRLGTFVVSGMAGRVLRFGALAWGGHQAGARIAGSAATTLLGLDVGGGR